MEVGTRRRAQPAPPHVVFEALCRPDRDPDRPWLNLRDDERRPEVLEASEPDLVVWTSLWDRRPDARIRFELPRDRTGYGTDLRWRLFVDEPSPDPALLGRLRQRLDELINADLRYTFGQ